MTATRNPYGALVGPGLDFAGIDQGIDFTGKGKVKALGAGVITRDVASGSGWPGQGAVLVEKLTSGPYKGSYVYISEDFAADPRLKVGSTVAAGQVLGEATGSNLAPGIEVGWADKNGRPLAPKPPARPASQYTAIGQNFDNSVQELSGVTTPAVQFPAGRSGAALPGTGPASPGPQQNPPGNKGIGNPLTGWVGDLTGWLSAKAPLVLAYILLIGVAAGLFLTGLKGLGMPIPKAVPVPV